MELESGVCNLCNVNNMVFKASEGDKNLKILTEFLDGHFLSQTEFQKIKQYLHLCVICSWKLHKLDEINEQIETESHNIGKCYFCKSEVNNITIQSGWKYFENMTKPFVLFEDMPIAVCPDCMFFFDSLQVIKTNLLVKFPNLIFGNEFTIEVGNNTPKKKSPFASNVKQKKIFNNCFNNLEPLAKTSYNIKRSFKKDLKLYKRIPYVCITKQSSNKKKTFDKNFMKIKLKDKPSTRRSTSLRRNASFTSTKEDIEETPKAANSSELAPKRRVSVYAEPETNNDDEISDASSMLNDDISEIVEKYINHTSLQVNDNVALLKDLENKVDKMLDDENADKDHNNVEEVANNDQDNAEEVEETAELSVNVDPMDKVLSKLGNIINVTADTIDIDEDIDNVPNDTDIQKSSNDPIELSSVVEKNSDEAIEISSENSSKHEEQESEDTCINAENVNDINTDLSQTESEEILPVPIEDDIEDVIEKQSNEEPEKSLKNICEEEESQKNDAAIEESQEIINKTNTESLNCFEQNELEEEIHNSEEMNLSLSPDIAFMPDKEEDLNLDEQFLSDSNVIVEECKKSILNESVSEPERKKKRVTFSM